MSASGEPLGTRPTVPAPVPAARPAAPSGDSLALPAPLAPATPAGHEFASGMQAATAQNERVVERLEGMLDRLETQLSDANERIREDRESYRDKISALESEWRTRLDEMRDKLADERDKSSKADQHLAIEKLRAELTTKGESSMAERVIEPLLGSLPGVMAARGPQHAAAPVYAAPVAPPAVYADAAPAPPPAAPADAPPPAQDPDAVANALLSKFETGVLNAVTDAIRSQATGGDVSGGTRAVTQGLALLSKAGITPPTGLFARVALNSVFNALQEGQPAQAVADALRPVVAVAGAASQFLNSLSPAVAADMLAGLAGVAVPPELKDFLVEVVGLVATGDAVADSSPLDAGEIPSTAR